MLRLRDKMKKKGALEISFGWLFALIAGAVILFFAIYFSVRLIGTNQEVISAQTGRQIGILLDPLETSFESAQSTSISIPAETRIHNTCDDFTGDFGRQIIQLDQKNFNKWSKTDVDVFFNNKYIFSETEIEGKKFYLFSKPFEFPFKIADLIYMTSANKVYCFVSAPDEIEKEIIDLNQSNMITGECSEGQTSVCFGSGNCDININYNSGVVEKDGEMTYFTGIGNDKRALMYAAIFSDKEVYECQIKRLMMRVSEISLLYRDKELITIQKGCGEDMGEDLVQLSELASGLDNSQDLNLIKLEANIIEDKNNARICMLW